VSGIMDHLIPSHGCVYGVVLEYTVYGATGREDNTDIFYNFMLVLEGNWLIIRNIVLLVA
jgi:hypothetical protein